MAQNMTMVGDGEGLRGDEVKEGIQIGIEKNESDLIEERQKSWKVEVFMTLFVIILLLKILVVTIICFRRAQIYHKSLKKERTDEQNSVITTGQEILGNTRRAEEEMPVLLTQDVSKSKKMIKQRHNIQGKTPLDKVDLSIKGSNRESIHSLQNTKADKRAYI